MVSQKDILDFLEGEDEKDFPGRGNSLSKITKGVKLGSMLKRSSVLVDLSFHKNIEKMSWE